MKGLEVKGVNLAPCAQGEGVGHMDHWGKVNLG
jgi:hypothetical protein